MVGADVSVSTIQDQTRVALASVGLVTLAILFLGSLSTLWISRRLTAPIRAVQDRAIHLAAGHFDTVIEPPRLRELAVLTQAFNEMTETLQSSVEELGKETVKVERTRTRRHLLRELASRQQQTPPLPDGVELERAHGQHEPLEPEAVPATLDGTDIVVLRLSDENEEPVQALASRAEFAWLAPRVASELASSVDELLDILEGTDAASPAALVVVEPAAARVTLRARADVDARLIAEDHSDSRVLLPARGSYDVPAEGVLVLSNGNASGDPGSGPVAPESHVRISGGRA